MQRKRKISHKSLCFTKMNCCVEFEIKVIKSWHVLYSDWHTRTCLKVANPKNSRHLTINEFLNRNPRLDLNRSQCAERAKQKLWSYLYREYLITAADGIDSTGYFVFINMFIFVSFQIYYLFIAFGSLYKGKSIRNRTLCPNG